MIYEKAKIYSDGSHYIAIPHTTRWTKPRLKKQEKEIKKMQDELKKGDKVITYTGLSGTIEDVLEDRIILKTRPDNVKLSIEKWAVAGLDDRAVEESTKK